MISTTFATESDDGWSNWDNQTSIDVSITGDHQINLDSSNRLVRAHVNIVNFDPSDGHYMMRVIQPLTDKIISEKEIIIQEKSNDEAGSDVAYLIDDDVIRTNGTLVLGEYSIEIFSEKGNAIGGTTFSIIKPSVNVVPIINDELSPTEPTEKVDNNQIASDENSLQTNPKLENVSKIPSWVKNIFVLYSDGSITENELLTALQFLIEQGIIVINQ